MRGPSFRAIAALALMIAAHPAIADPTAEASCAPGRSLLADLAGTPAMAEIEARAAETPNGEGLLFRIEREGVPPSHLFATMHLSDRRVLDLPVPVEDAFAAAKTIVIETTDILDETRMASTLLLRPDLTMLPQGQTLAELLSPADYEELSSVLAQRGIPSAAVQPLQPWFLTLGLAMPACEAERQANGEEALDLRIARRAEAAGKTLLGLETAGEQIEALASLPLELQAENLVATADLVDEMPDIFETMIELYVAGRISTILPVVERISPAGSDEAESAKIYLEFENRIVHARNHRMAERLEEILNEGDALVAVGALHVPGTEGLVALLRESGWTVTRAH